MKPLAEKKGDTIIVRHPSLIGDAWFHYDEPTARILLEQLTELLADR